MQYKDKFIWFFIVILCISFSLELSLDSSSSPKPISIYSNITKCYNREDCNKNYYIDLSEYFNKNIKISIFLSSKREIFSINQIYYSFSPVFDSNPTNIKEESKTYSDTSGMKYYEYVFDAFPSFNQKYLIFHFENNDYSDPITIKLKSINYQEKIFLGNNSSKSSEDDYLNHFWETGIGSFVFIILSIIITCCCKYCCDDRRQ